MAVQKSRKTDLQKQTVCFLSVILLCFSMIMNFNIEAFAAQDGEKINKISLNVQSDLTVSNPNGSVTVSTNDSEYSVVSCQFYDEPDSWKPGAEPKVEIELAAESGYYFNKSIRSSKISLKGGAKYVSIKFSEDADTAVLKIKLDKLEGTLADVGTAYWSGSTLGKAEWDEVENARAYELKLYRGSSVIFKIDKITETTANLFRYMDKKGVYYYRVRPIPKNSDEKDYLTEGAWIDSEELEIEEEDAKRAAAIGGSGNSAGGNVHSGAHAGSPGGGIQTGQAAPGGTPGTPKAGGPAGDPSYTSSFGWLKTNEGWWYKNADGSYTKNGWQAIDGKWYLFDLNGYMKTGWQRFEGKLYYLNSGGDMQTGWLLDNRLWYYFMPNGEMAENWVFDNGSWYFMGVNGVMVTGWIEWNGLWYYLNPADGGRMAVNTYIDSYYVNADGVWVQ